MFLDGDDTAHFVVRQLWNPPTETTSFQAHCTPFTLPSNGVIMLGDQSSITLTTDVLFQPECTGTSAGEQVFNVDHLKDPFYASTIPMVYVIAAATVIAWVLVVMLSITQRTNFGGVPLTAGTFTNAHGIIGGANGGGSGFSGSGSRPWLQKAAALAVAISLTIATADTLQVAERQYHNGYQDAQGLRKEVLSSTEIKVMRVVSDVFLWLAQVQTLIRLFPRHKEKVLIKWIGFALIVLDSIFSCLNSFLIDDPRGGGRRFVDAIPALSYLFELALGLLYAAWVLYYSLTKRQYAFYTAKMRSISLIALLSFIAILTPVVFFITDVVNQDVAGWGDYFRWVGAAAASVVVWEWVERMEALERDDKKDGILGREIFDGDEMLDVMPNDDTSWSHSRNLGRLRRRDVDNPENGNRPDHGLNSMMPNRFRSRHDQGQLHFPLGRAHSGSEALSSTENATSGTGRGVTFSQPPRPNQQQNSGILGGPTPPPMIASPISRADTTSAASTVYVVRQPMADVPQPIRRRRDTVRSGQGQGRNQRTRTGEETIDEKDWVDVEDENQRAQDRTTGRWHAVPNPFKRKRSSPPQEVQRARAARPGTKSTTQSRFASALDMRSRLTDLTAGTSERLRDRAGARRPPASNPVTVVPAQPRGSGRTWSPNERAFIDATPAPPEGGDENDSESHTQNGVPRTTVRTGAQRPTVVFEPQLPRAETFSPPVVPTTTSSPLRAGPPRADDISPSLSRGPNRTVVVPPPPRRTPSYQNSPSPSRLGGSGAGSTVP